LLVKLALKGTQPVVALAVKSASGPAASGMYPGLANDLLQPALLVTNKVTE
jgi:hypothetical protein